MSVVTKIISVVLKSVTDNKISNELTQELIGVSINGVSEFGINKIKDFINGEKAKIERILSKENMKSMSIPQEIIDYVVEEIKDLFSTINITDEVLRQCRYDSMNLSVFLWDEYRKDKDGYIECENSIKCCLFKIAQVLIELVHESKNFEKEILTQMSNSIDDANVGLQKISGYMEDNFGKLDENSQTVLNILLTILEQIQKMNMQENETISITAEVKKFQNNKKQDYINLWNSRLFLHLDNDERPITMAEAFIEPDYKIYQYSQKISFSDRDALNEIIEKFLNYKRTSTMLITGVPGMGKTTIVSWLAHKFRTVGNLIILRFRDWDYNDFRNGLLNAICVMLCCNRKDLSDKILILDGFDEIKCLDRRNRILTGFINDINDLERSKIIITSRPFYIEQIHFNNNIILRPFNIKKIKMFYKNITGKKLNENDVDTHNLDVLGVPVILYMAIMSNIDITKSATKPELYGRIFAENGGIFDKFCEYDSGSQIMRNLDNKICYLEFLRTTAFKMFEKYELVLSRNECEIPELSFQGKDVSVLEFPIKHLFENTSVNIEFIHTSIFEYFVSEHIFYSINEIIKKDNFKIEDLACIMGRLFKYRRLTPEIIEFLEYKVRNSFNDKYDIVSNAFNLMLVNGMTYYTGECYRNIIDCELSIFSNMLEIMHLWDKDYFGFENKIAYYAKYIIMNNNQILNCNKVDLSNVDFSKMDLTCVYLKKAILNEANLNGVNLSSVDLSGVSLVRANLVEARLSRSHLLEANLTEANLTGADLTEANLTGADLTKVNFRECRLQRADMRNADLSFADLTRVKLVQANLESAILIETILTGADLGEANLSYAVFTSVSLMGADLRGANLIGVYLRETDLYKANLMGAIFDEIQIGYLKQEYNLNGVQVYRGDELGSIMYEEYCKWKKSID